MIPQRWFSEESQLANERHCPKHHTGKYTWTTLAS
jgi:hypothetical protein